jgi:peptide/nickel transport system permease protein
VGAAILAVVILAALLAGVISTHDPRRLNPAQRLKAPSATNFLGTDEFGRDVYSLVLHGAQVSLLVGATTMILTSLWGIVIGLIAGYYRRVDMALMRVMDGLMAFPAILLAIALMAARGPGIGNVIFALSVVYTPRTAMLIRSTVLSLRELDYVQAARALGRRDLAIAFRHILPNCVGPLLEQASFIFATQSRRGYPGLPRRGRAAVRPVVGQRHRQRQERDPRGLLGEPLPWARADHLRAEPEPPGRRSS